MSTLPTSPLITIAVPSFNQGRFLDDALTSIFQQKVPVEVFVMDGGSSDNSVEIINRWAPQLAGWRSCADEGQAAAINEGIALGSAPFVCWLNSDDWFLSGGISTLVEVLQKNRDTPAAYGRSWNVIEKTNKRTPVWVEEFDENRLAMRCIISQPATLIRRSAWEAVGGLDISLHMALDYDLWWRLFRQIGRPQFVDQFVAVNRDHLTSKTNTRRQLHYREAMAVVKKYNGNVPIKWFLYQPYAVWLKSLYSIF